MANTLTGGYDLCIELDSVLLTRVAAPVLLATPDLQNPVLRVTIGSGTQVVTGELTLFVTGASVQVAASTGPRVEVRLRFQGSALAVMAPRRDSAGDLSGTITFTAPVRLAAAATEPDGTRTRSVVVDLSRLDDLEMSVNEHGRRELDALMGRFGLDAGDAIAGLRDAAGAAAQIVSGLLGEVPLPFAVVLAPAGRDGTLDPLTFVDAQLVTAEVSGPFAKRALALLGTLVRDHSDRGEAEDKTELALRTGDGAAIVLSPTAFRRLVICPEVFRAVLPAYLQRELPGDFLSSLASSAFEPFLAALPNDDERRAFRQDLRHWIDEGDTEAFFERILPRPLPFNALDGLGPGIAQALPAAVQRQLRDTPAAALRLLPPQCGRSDGLPIPDARITYVGVEFQHGSMRLSGRILPDKTGVTGWLEFWSDLTLTVGEGTALEPAATDPAISSYLALEWWVHWLGAIALLSGFLYTFEQVEASRARREAEETIRGAVRSLRSVALTLPDGVTLSAVEIEPRGVVMRAVADPVDLPDLELPRVSLTWTRTGPATSRGPEQTLEIHNDCVDGTFTFTEIRQQFHYSYTAQALRISGPVRFEWFVNHQRAEGGGFLETEDGERLLGWTASGNGLTLFSNFPDRPLIVAVVVRATGGDGTTAEASHSAYFEGPLKIFDPKYAQRVRECLKAYAEELDRGFGATRPGALGPAVADILKRFIDRQPGRFGVIDPVELGTVFEAGELLGVAAPVWLRQAAQTSGAVRLPRQPLALRLRPTPQLGRPHARNVFRTLSPDA